VSVEEAQAELRRGLGLRPETRIDTIIFQSGEVWELWPDNLLHKVRESGVDN
jgi:hypothetical protein